LPYVVSGWLIGVFALSVWHLGGWAQLQRLRKKMVKKVDASLYNKLKVLAERLKVNRAVQLMESAMVQIPTVIGWLRPMILLPASALTGLSAEQLEAILAHELAHVKRFDYLVNILQTVVEILGFYHPAVWWISHKIRAERENCCDDLAVSISGDRVCYAKALTSMEEIRAGRGELAVAADGGNLFKRICRLVGKDSAEKTGFSWIPAAIAILLILALVIPTALALTAKSNPPQPEQKTDVQVEAKSALSTEKLKKLGLAVAMYADEHDNKLPETLQTLKPYIASEQDLRWIVYHVEYVGKGRYLGAIEYGAPIAYDKTLFEEGSIASVLFRDGHVESLEPAKIKDLFELDRQVEDSAKRLLNLGKALLIYANDHDDKYPLSLRRLRDYLNLEEFNWALANIEYLAHGKTIAVPPDTVIAYDKMLLAARNGTNVLFNDSHVEFVKPERLKELGISATEILIETKILSVSEDFLQSIGLDANSVHSSDAWSEHLVAESAVEPNSGTYSLILDGLHISFLLKAVQAHKGAAILAAPQVLTREGKTAEINILTEENYCISGYTEPNRPSDKPEPKKDKVEIGTRIWLKPELTPDNENIKLDFKMEIRQLLGYEEHKYKGKYIYLKPRTEVVSTKMPCLIPDGKTLLIVGLKITEQVSGAPILSKIPVLGELFRSRSKIKEQRALLILVKPIINPQQKAKKILPGEADSEEHIKSLARQLPSC